MNIELVNNYSDFSKLRQYWNDLLSKSDSDFPFMTYEWIEFWWSLYGVDKEMLIVTVKENDQLIAIAPFMRSKISWLGFPVTAITFIANGHCNRAALITCSDKPDLFWDILNYINHFEYSYDIMYLDYIVKDSSTYKHLVRTLQAHEIKYHENNEDRSPYIAISGTWEQYFKGRSSKFRHKINHTQKIFDQLNNYKITKYTADNIDEAMDQVMEISRNSWKFKQNTALANKKENLLFYPALAKKASDLGWLNIWILKIGNKPAAFSFNLLFKGKIYAKKIGYSEEFAPLSPSEFLNTAIIKEGFSSSLIEYDWLGKDDSYKMRWTSLTRQHLKYWIFTGTLYGKILYYGRLQFVAFIKNLFRRQIERNVSNI